MLHLVLLLIYEYYWLWNNWRPTWFRLRLKPTLFLWSWWECFALRYKWGSEVWCVGLSIALHTEGYLTLDSVGKNKKGVYGQFGCIEGVSSFNSFLNKLIYCLLYGPIGIVWYCFYFCRFRERYGLPCYQIHFFVTRYAGMWGDPYKLESLFWVANNIDYLLRDFVLCNRR